MMGQGDRTGRLLEAGLALSSELSLPVILQRIIDLAANLTGARYGALGVLGRDGTILGLVARHAHELVGADLATLAVPAGPGELLVGAADGLHAEELAGTVFPVEGSVSGEVIQTAKTVAVPDAAADQRVRQPALRAGGIGPALFAPLAVRGAVLGTPLVANATGGRLSGKGTCS
jgi:GAF domain-containing protein